MTLSYSHNDKPVMVKADIESQVSLELICPGRGEARTEREKEVWLLQWEDSSGVDSLRGSRKWERAGRGEGKAYFCLKGTVSLPTSKQQHNE